MARVDVIQTSFAAGEVGSSLFGRTDIAQYANACETVENFLVRPYGSLISTPGTKYVAAVSNSTLNTRLMKFVFNREDAYVIEAGDKYFRFFTNRGQVTFPAGTEDLSAYSANLKAHWKCNDNTNSTAVIDSVGTFSATSSVNTMTLSTTGISGTCFDLDGRYQVSCPDHADFTRTASGQPMSILGWFYYSKNSAKQVLISKSGEYELSIDASDQMSFKVESGNADTKLLLHCDGSDGSTIFTDSSASAHVATTVGTSQLDTAQKKFGTASGLFDGNSDYITFANHADWNMGTGDFCMDCWVRFSDTSGAQFIISYNENNDFAFVKEAIGTFAFYIGGLPEVEIPWSPVANTWYHLYGGRSGTTVYAAVNGVMGATGVSSFNVSDTGVLAVGASTVGNQFFKGWIDEARIIKGSNLYTSNFSVPAEPYQGAAQNSWSMDEAVTEGWHFFSAVFNGDGTLEGDCKLYLDGAIKALTYTSDASFVRMTDTSSLFRIGASSAAGANNFADKIDNVAFIHQALTSTEIAGLYSETGYAITTVFTEDELWDIQYTQLNDVIWLTHPNHLPQKLVRTAANSWAISEFNFKGGPFLDDNTTTTKLSMSSTTGTINITASTTGIFTLSGTTLGHHGSFWKIGGLAQTNTTTGLQEQGYVEIVHVINSYTATATVIKNLRATTGTVDWAEGAWSAVRGYPKCVTLHEARLWFARTSQEPQKVWGSKIYDYENYALDSQDDDDGINIALVSNESNQIRWLASGKSLVPGTFGGAFVVNSGSTDPITPENVKATEEVGFGVEEVIPRRIGSMLYYIQRFGKRLRELFYFWDQDVYKAVDRTILSPHVLGDGIVDMDYQQNPDTILYCVRTDGTLATLTREVDQDVTGWARQTTDGTYTSIAIIPSQTYDYDEAWVIVERWVNGSRRKYVEYFENIDVPDRQDQCVYLHSALTYDAYSVSSSSSATISLSASSGSVTVTCSTAYFVGEHVNKRLRAIDADGATIGEGIITATSSTTSLTLSITTTFNALSYTSGLWGISVSSVSGLDHLESKTVGILADGTVESLTRTVASGVIALGSNYFVVTAGLSYNQVIKTLPKEAGSPIGTAQGKLQRINELAFKLNRSYLGFYYGLDANNLDLLTTVDSTLTQSLTTTVIGNVPFRGGYQRGSQVYIKNTNPLPIELLSLITKLETFDK
jgi:hypothetical protein